MASFGPRGQLLWDSLDFAEFSPAGVLAVEACRLADRLDELDSLISSGDFDRNLLAEARQQAVVLKAILESSALKKSEHEGASDIDALAARRAARRSAAAGS